MKVASAACGAVLVLAMGCDEAESGDTNESDARAPVSDAGRDAGTGPDGASADPDSGKQNIVQPARVALFPMGFAVRSPTAMTRARVNKGVDPAAAGTRDERQAQLALLLAGTKLDDCGVLLGSLLSSPGDNVRCYGPQLDYKNHPDAMGGPADGQLPGGDLGMWTETEADGQACAAAKLNALIEKLARMVDFGLYSAASLVCTGRVGGAIELESSGDAGTGFKLTGKLDLTTSLKTALMVNKDLTIAKATLERLADAASTHVYHYELDVTQAGPMGTRTIHTEILHQSNPAAPGTYSGRIWGTVSGGMPVRSDAYSVGYDRSEATGRLRYHAVSASYDMTPTNVFDSTGHFNLKSNWQGNITQGIFDMDAATATTGNASFAWQAGNGDSHARVFNVFTEKPASTLQGCGFFGYGPRFDKTQTTLPDNSISTFICNWAGPSNNHTGLVGSAQKQCMTLNADGIFAPTLSAITYAPVNSCSASGSFSYKLATESTYSTTALTSNLVTLASDSDYAKYRAPTALP